MLALDQRGSLRTIIANGRDEREISDGRLIEFKTAAAAALRQSRRRCFSTAVWAATPRKWSHAVPLILSADTFDQKPSGPVEKSVLNPAVTPALIEECGAAAVKRLVVRTWGADVEFRSDLVGRFAGLARKPGGIALVEGIVRDSHAEFKTTQEHANR